MMKNTALRRAVAVLLVVLGALAMLFAPETWAGAILLALGVSLEMIGIALRHRDSP
jgi:protein-S-isoprenylcysteine O-methyltransferase Ste14